MNAKTTRILLRLQATLKRVGFALLFSIESETNVAKQYN